jgi:hypothetical protein
MADIMTDTGRSRVPPVSGLRLERTTGADGDAGCVRCSNMTDWLAWIGAVGGTVGAVGGVGALVVAVPAWRAGRASAEAAVRAAGAAEEAVAESRRVALLEFEKRHDELSPRHGLKVYFGLEPGTHGGHRWLWTVVETPRTYRVRGTARVGTASWDLGLPVVLHANRRTAKVEIEEWPYDRDTSEVQEIVLRFWPPADVDQVERWTCRCGRPLDGDPASADAGHWEVIVPVDYVDPRARGRAG